MFWRRKIRLPPELYDRAAEQAQRLGLPSVEAYVLAVLERDLRAADEEQLREQVLEKMKGLGYLE